MDTSGRDCGKIAVAAKQQAHWRGCILLALQARRAKSAHAALAFTALWNCGGSERQKVSSGRSVFMYGDTRPYKDDWCNKLATYLESIKDCRYCKAAKTRIYNKLTRQYIGYTQEAINDRVERAMCKSHREKLGTMYRTHPASEAYWSS